MASDDSDQSRRVGGAASPADTEDLARLVGIGNGLPDGNRQDRTRGELVDPPDRDQILHAVAKRMGGRPKKLKRDLVEQSGRVGEFFDRRGWKVEEVEGTGGLLAVVRNGSELACGDGRETEADVQFFGGPYGIQALATGGDRGGLIRATLLLQGAGLVPVLHGDYHKGNRGCGMYGVWTSGGYEKIPGISPAQITPEEAIEYILSHGGQYREYQTEHQETGLDVNVVPWTFVTDKTPLRFRQDIGTALAVINQGPVRPQPEMVYEFTATTVEALKSPVRSVRIIR